MKGIIAKLSVGGWLMVSVMALVERKRVEGYD
jgi:hypothetical protein